MNIPSEMPVMTLPHATLFPQALLPLYIFEPRYRRMLTDALQTHRLFIVARQRPGLRRESPESVAGLGFIRVAVGHKDGTSHLVLQGLTRVRLVKTVRYRPYRVQRIEPLAPGACDSVAADALMAKVRELADERLRLGLALPLGLEAAPKETPPQIARKAADDIRRYLNSLSNPEQLADLVSCAVLQDSGARQAILEAVNIEERLRKLILFLLEEIRLHRKAKGEGT
jgi:Lon protease-like protein